MTNLDHIVLFFVFFFIQNSNTETPKPEAYMTRARLFRVCIVLLMILFMTK